MSTTHNQGDDGRIIGLIGLGLVGSEIGELLLAQAFDVIGFDVVGEKCAALQALGGRAAASPKEVAQAARRVVLSLPDSDVVRDVVEGPGGIVQAERPPRYVIDTTTGDPDETIRLAWRLERGGIQLLDATISGSSRQVRDREAVFMVGGQEAALEHCADVFKVLSDKVFYLGASGSGSKAKLASNLILGLNRLVLAEGLVFADALGFDVPRFLELLRASPAYSVAMDVKGEKMLREDFTPQSRIRQHHKDVTLILKYAQRANQELPLSQVHMDVLEQALAAGEGDLDNAAVIREIRRRRAAQRGGPERESPGEQAEA